MAGFNSPSPLDRRAWHVTRYLLLRVLRHRGETETHHNAWPMNSWKGDAHAGYYDETVWQYVNGINTARFSSFSTLMRMTFDKAVTAFEDESIDLIHIDGQHFYRDVQHDFQTLVPKA